MTKVGLSLGAEEFFESHTFRDYCPFIGEMSSGKYCSVAGLSFECSHFRASTKDSKARTKIFDVQFVFVEASGGLQLASTAKTRINH